jgi:hypothetical protein
MADWIVMEVAPDQLTAEMWVEQLRREGVPAMIRPSDVVAYLGVSAFGCRVLVPPAHLEEARDLLGLDEDASP